MKGGGLESQVAEVVNRRKDNRRQEGPQASATTARLKQEAHLQDAGPYLSLLFSILGVCGSGIDN